MFCPNEWLAGVGPVTGGVIAGLLHTVLGPDHLCTIITLSACQGFEAFWFGVRWAEGHIVGMAIVGCVVALLNVSLGDNVFEAYEHYADYVVGFMLVGFGVYFMIHADRFFDEKWRPAQSTCACHAHLAPAGHGHGHSHQFDQEQPSETTPIKPKASGEADEKARKTGSVLVGFIQGLCCPGGLVGVLFLKQYALSDMFVFMAVFFCVTILAMGCLACLYGVLTQRYVTSTSLAKSIYYTSCSLSISFGLAWLLLNLTGRLDLLGHSHGHGHAHGHGHDDGHHDHPGHAHDHSVPSTNLLLLMLAP